MKLSMETVIDDAVIETRLLRHAGKKLDEMAEVVRAWSMDTRDKQTNAALVKMGWGAPGGGWVSVAERLPDGDGAVLSWDGYAINLAYLSNGRLFILGDSTPLEDVTHWMPLPAPPVVAP